MLRRELLRLGAGSLAVSTAGCLDWTPSNPVPRTPTPTPPTPLPRAPAPTHVPSPAIPEPPVHWRRTYRNLGDVGAVLPHTDGYLLLSDTYVGTESLASLVVLLVDGEGRERWRRTYSTLGYRYAGVPVKAGGWVLVGCTEIPDDRDTRAFALTENGDERWRQSFSETEGVLSAAASGSDDAVVLCGYHGTPGIDERPWAVCLNADGAIRWERTPDVPGEFGSVAPAPDGYVFVTTRRETVDDANATKLDNEGREVWSRHYRELDRLYGVRAIDGGYVLFGEVSLGESAPSRLALLAVGESGDPRWGYRYGPSDSESFGPFQATDLLSVPEGGFVFGGNYFVYGGAPGPDYRPALLGVAAGGDRVEWLAAYGGGTSGGAEAIFAAPEGYLYGGWMAENGRNTAVLAAVPPPSTSNVDPFSAVPLSPK